MAIYKRPLITIKTLELLKRHIHPFERIIAVGSCNTDKQTANKAIVDYTEYKNFPVSEKWQHGIYCAQQYDPDAIMICGSDAWLSTNWCMLGKEYVKDGYDIVGKKDFYTCYLAPNSKLSIIGRTYRTRKDPVGSGRLISRNILDKLNWQLYPTGLNSCMDGESYKRMINENAILKVITEHPEMIVMSIKSPLWETITSYSHIANHRMFVPLEDITDNEIWLNTHFPEAIKDLKDIAPTAII